MARFAQWLGRLFRKPQPEPVLSTRVETPTTSAEPARSATSGGAPRRRRRRRARTPSPVGLPIYASVLPDDEVQLQNDSMKVVPGLFAAGELAGAEGNFSGAGADASETDDRMSTLSVTTSGLSILPGTPQLSGPMRPRVNTTNAGAMSAYGALGALDSPGALDTLGTPHPSDDTGPRPPLRPALTRGRSSSLQQPNTVYEASNAQFSASTSFLPSYQESVDDLVSPAARGSRSSIYGQSSGVFSRSRASIATRLRSSSIVSQSTVSVNSLSISAPVPSSLVTTSIVAPKQGFTPDQLKFLTQRDNIGKFGRPGHPMGSKGRSISSMYIEEDGTYRSASVFGSGEGGTPPRVASVFGSEDDPQREAQAAFDASVRLRSSESLTSAPNLTPSSSLTSPREGMATPPPGVPYSNSTHVRADSRSDSTYARLDSRNSSNPPSPSSANLAGSGTGTPPQAPRSLLRNSLTRQRSFSLGNPRISMYTLNSSSSGSLARARNLFSSQSPTSGPMTLEPIPASRPGTANDELPPIKTDLPSIKTETGGMLVTDIPSPTLDIEPPASLLTPIVEERNYSLANTPRVLPLHPVGNTHVQYLTL